jgi:protein TonB
MNFKLNSKENSMRSTEITSGVLRKPIFISSSLHFMIVGLFLVLYFINYKHSDLKKITFTVLRPEVPIRLAKPVMNEPVAQQPLAKKLEAKPKAVFGLNKNTILSKSTEGSEISIDLKEGNTLAKPQDSEKLNPEDETNLPLPTDEFLVSSMPVLISEVRIPYPKAAREANIEGPVVMDLLIDGDGKVRNVVLISGPGYGLNEAALQAVQNFKFRPAKVENQSVAVKIRYTYRFVLELR